MKYVFSTTKKCANSCVICGALGKPSSNYFHIGQNEKEVQAIRNLITSFGRDELSLTGGDPLMNDVVLREVVSLHHGKKGIIFNPITFLVIELRKNAKCINNSDISNLKDKAAVNGLSEKNREICYYLSRFDSLTISNGNLQAPSPEMMSHALDFYSEFILSEIKKNNSDFNEESVCSAQINGKFESTKLISTNQALCVGRFREYFEKNMRLGGSGNNMPLFFKKEQPCSEKDELILYFKRSNKSAYIVLDICCSVGITTYFSYNTNISLDDLAQSRPKEIKKMLYSEARKLKSTALYNMLNNPEFNNPSELEKKAWYYPEEKLNEQFREIVCSSEELLWDNTGTYRSIIDNVYSFGGQKCSECEVCNTLGIMLYKAGISIKEWHDFLDISFNKRTECQE